MWVKLKVRKNVEIQGKMKSFSPGDWIDVGKQTALQWIAAGEADGDPARNKLVRRQADYTAGELAFTLFAVPMAFLADKDVKQRNALTSWTLLEPPPQVVLFGNEQGIADVAAEMEFIHLPRIERNGQGTPIVSDAFHQMGRLAAPSEVVCYVNSDIILLQDWADALVKVSGEFERFLMIGQRWDVNLDRPLLFREGWDKRLRHLVANQGELHGKGAIDYFAHRPGLYDQVPPFAIGRSAWDNWLVGHALDAGVEVVDASNSATVVHQDRRGPPGAAEPILTDARLRERACNRALYDADRDQHGFTGKVSEAPWVMNAAGKITQRESV